MLVSMALFLCAAATELLRKKGKVGNKTRRRIAHTHGTKSNNNNMMQEEEKKTKSHITNKAHTFNKMAPPLTAWQHAAKAYFYVIVWMSISMGKGRPFIQTPR